MSNPVLEERDPVADDVFRVLLDLHMVSDPWPLNAEQHGMMLAFLECEASERGYKSWVEAYHEFNAEEVVDDE